MVWEVWKGMPMNEEAQRSRARSVGRMTRRHEDEDPLDGRTPFPGEAGTTGGPLPPPGCVAVRSRKAAASSAAKSAERTSRSTGGLLPRRTEDQSTAAMPGRSNLPPVVVGVLPAVWEVWVVVGVRLPAVLSALI